ncbi:DUF2934 domain-containing protein [Methylomonas sp. LL1]|uniref:DUF2934 domain-containing protein n=1 Tax=Methylomonas sp. LL1 TaxID=2785785 RepID=UPI0018C3E88D|nr:DUF2934 domain-containing protein [Methylomonas sp. LL1]QPK65292.1 DUF2934 domain-containing protein [Methylomonas sp. LL1]
MAEFNFEFDFDEEIFTPVSFHDKIEKQKLKEFEQEMQTKNVSERHCWISECAYYKAEHRGFESGLELDDWLAAEAEFMKRNNKQS